MRTRIPLWFFLLASAAAAQSPPGTAREQAAPPPATQTLNVNASLVVVPVTVRDGKDRLVRNLKKEDFVLTADGKPQTIRYFDPEDDLPLTVGLLVDVSGSLRSELDDERAASAAFLDGMLQPDRDRAFIVQFGRSADLLADVTPSLPKLEAALKKIDAQEDRPAFSDGNADAGGTGDTRGDDTGSNGGYGRGGRGRGRSGGGGGHGGGTVLYDAVFLSADEVLAKAPAAKNGPARKAMILLTDGQDNGSKESIASAIEAAQRTDAILYAIYFKGEEFRGGGSPGGGRGGFPGMGGRFPGGGGGYPGGGGGYPGGGGGRGGGQAQHTDGRKILERITGETGGRMYEVSKKMPLNEIYRQIAEELRSQYRLGFSPSDMGGGYHRVTVDLPKDKKAILQFRDGYYSGK
jgi:VWFA-related protein